VFRHSVAIRSLERGDSLDDVRRTIGHLNPMTTAILKIFAEERSALDLRWGGVID
jgi:site-specific recombinase XerD